MLAKQECVGLTIEGFYFHRFENCSHVPSMKNYIGKLGKITGIGPSGKTYRVRFTNDSEYSYPADKVHELFFSDSIDLNELFNQIKQI